MNARYPPSWPPAPETGAVESAKKPVNKAAGKASFGLAVCLLLAQLFTWWATFTAGDGPKILGFFIHSSPVLLALCLCAVVLGIIGWRSLPGKLAVALCLVNFALYAYLLNQYLHLTF